jgi:hypothetical protein
LALWDKYEYKPGLTFGSKMAAEVFIIRGRKDIFSSDGTKIDEIPELTADFAVHGGEFSYTAPDGSQDTAANINGHFFDLDLTAEQKDWSEDERALAGKRLLWACDKFPGDIWLHSAAALPLPWATYDETPYGKIAATAEIIGAVAEALNYESQNKQRPSVIKDLEAALVKSVPEVEVDDSLLTAA